MVQFTYVASLMESHIIHQGLKLNLPYEISQQILFCVDKRFNFKGFVPKKDLSEWLVLDTTGFGESI